VHQSLGVSDAISPKSSWFPRTKAKNRLEFALRMGAGG
jgi:hypothetical protein